MVPQFGGQCHHLTSLRQAQPDLLVDLSSEVRFGIFAASPFQDSNHSLNRHSKVYSSLTSYDRSTTTGLMPASEKSDRPLFFIALFAEPEPKPLIKELVAALYEVSPDKALNSLETMEKLNALSPKVKDFPLD